jgi:hypothetical protein
MANTTNFGWETPDDTDLVKDGAAAIRTLGSAIDASLADLEGGTTGQVLKKNSNTDMDFIWAADSAGMTNPMTTTGDTIYSSSGSTPARLAIGSTGNVLTVAGGVPTWAAPAGGGKVLQVVMGTTTTATTIASTSFTDTTLTASITPSSATSKVLVFFTQAIRTERDSGAFSQGAGIQIVRDSTAVFTPADSFRAASSTDWSNSESGKLGVIASGSYLDTPATTSATTYKTQARAGFTTFNGQIKVNESGNTSSIILMEIGA